jgi:hypothetical protein
MIEQPAVHLHHALDPLVVRGLAAFSVTAVARDLK